MIDLTQLSTACEIYAFAAIKIWKTKHLLRRK